MADVNYAILDAILRFYPLTAPKLISLEDVTPENIEERIKTVTTRVEKEKALLHYYRWALDVLEAGL